MVKKTSTTTVVKPIIPWRSIRNLKITADYYEDLLIFLQNGTLPPRIKNNNNQTKFKRLAKFFSLDENDQVVLVDNDEKLYDTKGSRVYKVIHKDEIDAVLNKAWNVRTGFRGVRSFLEQLQQEFIGISRSDVDAFLKRQSIHQQDTYQSLRVVQPIVESEPNRRWVIDHIIMESRRTKNQNYAYVLNIIDHHSKFVWSFPTKNKDNITTASLLQNLMLVEGAPKILQADNAFRGQEFELLASRFNLDIRYGEPYSPQTQGAIEKFNKTLKTGLFGHMRQYQTDSWLEELPFVVNSYNNTKHSTTGFTPFVVLRGRDERLQTISNMATFRTEKLAEKMITKKMKQSSAMKEDLRKGDLCRVWNLALSAMRKLGKIGRKAKGIPNFSEDVYRVVSITNIKPEELTSQDRSFKVVKHKKKPDVITLVDDKGKEQEFTLPGREKSIQKYKLAHKDTGKVLENGKSFFRWQLQKISPDTADTKDITERERLGFGHDIAVHIATLSNRDVVEKPQAEIDKQNKVKDDDFNEKQAARQSRNRRLPAKFRGFVVDKS